uniref:Transposase Tc1-like domain-containing protein n=1 Tax=Amphilophus citrinellus TaxID=61819 RepID=A0A3Q0SXG1_AMPCI
MVKRRELTEKERVRIKALHDAGWSFRRIGQDIKCSHSVVKYALESIAETGTYKMRQGRGRKQKLTEADVRHLKILSTRDRRKTTADLQAEINASRSESEKVSRMTISRRLNEQGLKGRIPAKKPLLRPANTQKRLRFAREHKHWTVDDWKKVLWTDEFKFELFGQHRHRKAGERFDARCISHMVEHGGDSIMVWGSISGNEGWHPDCCCSLVQMIRNVSRVCLNRI